MLPELPQLEIVSMTDTNSGYQQVPLDLASSLLTTFNTPWEKFRFLKLPFGLKMTGDVFQERLNKITRLVDGMISIADDILIPRKCANHDHDARVLTLLETARMNNVTLNAKKFKFKSTDCPFFGHNLTPAGLKIDPKKVEAILSMEPPTNMKDLQFPRTSEILKQVFSQSCADCRTPTKIVQERYSVHMGITAARSI